MFFMFSSRLGVLASVLISLIVTVLLLRACSM